MSKTEPKVKSITLLDRQTQLEAEIKRLKALLPVRRKGESDENYAFRVDQANANFKARGNLNIKGDKNRIISSYRERGHTAYSDQLQISQSKIPFQYIGATKKFNTIGNTITNLESALTKSRAQIGKRYLNKKESRQLGVKWNPTLANDSKMVNPDYNEFYDLKYAKPIVIDLPNGGTLPIPPAHPKYWELKGGQKFTHQELNPSLKFNKPLSKLNIKQQPPVEPGDGAELTEQLGAKPEDVSHLNTKGTEVNPVEQQKIKERAPNDLAWVKLNDRAKGHTLVGADYRGSVGGKNSVANNKARLLLDRARAINRAYGSQNETFKQKMLDNPRTQLEIENW